LRRTTFICGFLGFQFTIVFLATTLPLRLLELFFLAFEIPLLLSEHLGTLAFLLFTFLSSLNSFDLGIPPTERSTFLVIAADTKCATHLAHLVLLGSSERVTLMRLECSDGSLGLGGV
jgi:hypothetical protein